jgi:VWFA-related protein
METAIQVLRSVESTENIESAIQLKASPTYMKAFFPLRIFPVVLAISLFIPHCSGQAAASGVGNPSQAASQNSGSANTQITLDVVVADKSGKPQAGLQQQDFTLLDNKTPQKILSFQAVEEPAAPAVPPVEIVLVIDTVNTSPQTIANERLQIQKYLRQNGGKLAHPTSVVVFSDAGLNPLGDPTLDGNALSATLDGNDVIGLHAMHQASGANGDWERFNSSLSKLYSLAGIEVKKPGKKLVIWISPGWPMLASTGAEMYSKQKEQLFTILVRVSTALRLARITLYSIDPEGASGGGFGRLQTKDEAFGRFSYESYLKGVPSAKEVMPANLALQVLVTRSGGRVLTTGNDIGAQIEDCVADTRAFYILSFAAVHAERPDDYHALELKVGKPKLTAHTSAGYYAQP